MALIAAQTVPVTGLEATYQAAAGGGDTFRNTGKERFHVKNGGGSPITVTLVAQNPCSFGVSNVAHDKTITVTNAEDRFISVPDMACFNDADGLVHVSYSGVTSVTVAVLK